MFKVVHFIAVTLLFLGLICSSVASERRGNNHSKRLTTSHSSKKGKVHHNSKPSAHQNVKSVSMLRKNSKVKRHKVEHEAQQQFVCCPCSFRDVTEALDLIEDESESCCLAPSEASAWIDQATSCAEVCLSHHPDLNYHSKFTESTWDDAETPSSTLETVCR